MFSSSEYLICDMSIFINMQIFCLLNLEILLAILA